jgi:hypothetical protein
MKSFSLPNAALGFLSFSSIVTALGQKPSIDFTAGNGSYLLATRSSHVNLVLDAADWPGVLRAAHDVAVDFGRVTGLNGSVTASGTGTLDASNIFNVTGINKDWSVGSASGKSNGTASGTIIAGTIGNSSLIDGLIKSGKIDVSAIEGKWEAFVSVVVQNPTNGTAEALVIAGSYITLQKSIPVNFTHDMNRKRPPRHNLRPLRRLRANWRVTMALLCRRSV